MLSLTRPEIGAMSKQYVVDMEKELSITKMLLGFMGAAWLLLLGCTLSNSCLMHGKDVLLVNEECCDGA
jgi:hypothetical protein